MVIHGVFHRKKDEFPPLFGAEAKINSKWIKCLNAKFKIFAILVNNTIVYLYELWQWEHFLNHLKMHSAPQITRSTKLGNSTTKKAFQRD